MFTNLPAMPTHPPSTDAPSRPTRATPDGARPDGEARRRQILEAAIACFAERGYSGTTTRELAQRVGITEAALYRYYPSKQSLYDAIIDANMTPIELAAHMAPFDVAGNEVAFFEELASEIFRRIDGDPHFLRILMYSALEGHAMAGPFFASRVRQVREYLTGYVTRRIESGVFRPIDPVLAARAFLGMVFDHIVVCRIYDQQSRYPHRPEQVAATFTAIFLGGLRRPDEARADSREQDS